MAKKSMMEILKERLEQMDQKSQNTGSGNFTFLNIKDGRNVIRILPPKEDAEVFYEEGFVHYQVGATGKDNRGKMVVCPTSKSEDAKCPICEEVKALWQKSSNKDDKYAKAAKAKGRKPRVYYNAISRDDINNGLYEQREVEKDGETKLVWFNTKEDKEESPVKVLATGIGILKDIIGIMVDPEYGDVTDPEEGLDLIITKSGSGQYGTNYDVKTVRKESPIGVEGWQDDLNDLTGLFKTKTYEEIQDMMAGNDSSDDEDDEDEEDVAPTKSPKKEEDSSDDATDEDVEAEIRAALERRKKKQ
ncbi:hypothetical protein EalM132_00126 [Exiguobacterium phage vB_EalM-132]|nr:hypothetical protein EalM132_00126 [Exiguobacterium phage vB_EalM-132]